MMRFFATAFCVVALATAKSSYGPSGSGTDNVVESESEIESESLSESEIETDSVSESESEVETEIESESLSESEIETDSVSESESEVETETETETETEIETESEIVIGDYVSRETFESMLSSLRSSFAPVSYNISDPFYSYLVSIALSRAPFAHYVAFADTVTSGSYTTTVYRIAVGDLIYDGSKFSGDVTLYTISASVNRFPHYTVSSDQFFTFSPGSALVFTDLSDRFVDFTAQYRSQFYVFYLLVFVVVFYTLTKFFRTR